MTNTVLLIHGMWCTGAHLARVQGGFERAGFRCVAPTLRRDGNPGLRDYVDQLERALDGERAILVGHSLGGLLAQLLAQRVQPRALVLLAPVPPAAVSALSFSGFRTLAGVLARWAFWRKTQKPGFARFRYGIFNPLAAAEQRAIYDTLVPESGRATFESLLPFLDGKRAAEVDFARVSCPVFVAGAGADRATPPHIARKLARRYSAGEYREYSELSHWMITEPGIERVVTEAAAWLRKSGAVSPSAISAAR